MVNPRVMEGYTPGVDDDPSSYTAFPVDQQQGVASSTAPPLAYSGGPTALQDVPFPRQPDNQPVVQPNIYQDMPQQQQQQPQPIYPPPPPQQGGMVSLDEEQPSGDITAGSGQTPYTADTTAPKPPGVVAGGAVVTGEAVNVYQHTPQGYPSQTIDGYDKSGHSGNNNTSGNNKKWIKWIIVAIVAVVLLIVLIVAVAVVALRDDDDDNDDPKEPVPIPDVAELQRSVKAYLTQQDLGSVRSTYGEIAEWDVSRITDFSQLFSAVREPSAEQFNPDISKWNVENGVNFRGMFEGAKAFNADVSGWSVGKATDFSSAFLDAAAFDQDLSSWDMSRVTTIQSMFQRATSFNQDLSAWKLPALTSMSSAFFGATSFSQSLCDWADSLNSAVAIASAFESSSCPEADNPTNMSASPPGPLCFSCKDPTVEPSAPPSTAPTTTPECFKTTPELTAALDSYLQDPSGGLTAATYGHPIGSWCTSSITSFREVFSASRNAAMATFNEDVSGWDTR